jgi:hypothetical protein
LKNRFQSLPFKCNLQRYLTVYEKGAEVIRMYHTLLGKAGFRKGMDLYFQRHDGQAVTTVGRCTLKSS